MQTLQTELSDIRRDTIILERSGEVARKIFCILLDFLSVIRITSSRNVEMIYK